MEMFEAKLERLQKQQNGTCFSNCIPVIENCSLPIFPGFFDYHTFPSFDWNVKNRNEICPTAADLMRYGSIATLDYNNAEFSEAAKDEVPARSCLTGTDSSLPGSPSCRLGVAKVAKREAAEGEDMDACLGNHRPKVSQKRQAEMSGAKKRRTERIRVEIERHASAGEDGSPHVSEGSFKENKKTMETKKQDYIHVRARRGQATDSHSLAERARREKISKKMKNLQDLVPGCNKVAGRAGMLDEIINYVQSLQRQVEFLSMKLATLSPIQQTGVDIFAGQEHHAIKASYPAAHFLQTTLPQLQLNPVHQQVYNNEPDTLINPQEIATTCPLLIPDMYPDSSSCYPRIASSWDHNK